MRRRYAAVRGSNAPNWLVIDRFTGWPVRLDDRHLTFAEESDARALAGLLDRLEHTGAIAGRPEGR